MLAHERTQPWLGTFVTIRVVGRPARQAHPAIDAAFAEIAAVHQRMSFHAAASDVGQMNRRAALEPVAVDPRTATVLRFALRLSRLSEGSFDVSVGAEMVRADLLPSPGAGLPPLGCWRDIEVSPQDRVRFHRPLWIDLGGIAKGFAVDQAIAALQRAGVNRAVVNAGGDLRVLGSAAERIPLDPGVSTNPLPLLDLCEGSVASSTGRAHIDGRTRRPLDSRRFAAVVSPRCMVADALTKLVIAHGAGAEAWLAGLGAQALFCDLDQPSAPAWLWLGRRPA